MAASLERALEVSDGFTTSGMCGGGVRIRHGGNEPGVGTGIGGFGSLDGTGPRGQRAPYAVGRSRFSAESGRPTTCGACRASARQNSARVAISATRIRQARGAGREDTGDRGQSRRGVSKRCRHAHHSTDFSGRRSARGQDSAERRRQAAGGEPQPRQLWRGAVQQPRRLHALRPLHHPWCRRLVRSRHLREWQRDRPGAGCRRLELRDGARHANHPARRASSRFLHDAAVPW